MFTYYYWKSAVLYGQLLLLNIQQSFVNNYGVIIIIFTMRHYYSDYLHNINSSYICLIYNVRSYVTG